VTELGSVIEGQPGPARHSRTLGFPPTGPAVGGAGLGPSQKAGRLSGPCTGGTGTAVLWFPARAVQARSFSGSQHGGSVAWRRSAALLQVRKEEEDRGEKRRAWPGGGALRCCKREKRRRSIEERREEEKRDLDWWWWCWSTWLHSVRRTRAPTSGCPCPSATIGTYYCHPCFRWCRILLFFNSLFKNIYPLLFLFVGLKIGHIRTDRFLFFRKDTLRKLAPPSQPGSFEISYLARFS